MFFRKKPEPKLELTFKERVERFWRDFSEVSDRFLATINDGRCADLESETSSLVRAMMNSEGWVYGPGLLPGSHSLTITAEGSAYGRRLTQYWVDQAPQLKGWNFHPSRQPHADIHKASIVIAGESYKPLQFWLTPDIDEDRELINLKIWSPAFLSLSEKARWQPLFLLLDEALGEDLVTFRLGGIEIREDGLAESMPLSELRAFVEETERRRGWSPLGVEKMSAYEFENPSNQYPRADIIAGHTSQRRLWRDYLAGDGEMNDPLEGTGATYYFLRIPTESLPDRSLTAERFRLEELFEAELKTSADGLCIGGGGGHQYGYIDFLLFDGKRSIDRVLGILRSDGVIKEATLHRFAGKPAAVVAKL